MDDRFHELVEPHRRELHAHCYRMVGSLHDAEDALQEALLRAWRGLPQVRDPGAVRSWLYTIATNTCLDLIARRPKRVLPVDYGPASSPLDSIGEPLTEVPWLEPYPDELDRYEQRETVELAFVAALQHLPANQRAVLILREVLGFSAREAAGVLDTSVASINSALQRARRAVDERLPARSQQATLEELGQREAVELVQAFCSALEEGDIDAATALLARDATFAMPPYPTWWRGRDEIAAFMRGTVGVCPPSRSVPARANAQPATASYSWDAARGAWNAAALDVYTIEDGRIIDVTGFVTPELFPRFGLPLELPATPPAAPVSARSGDAA
jgi:RNA polymerase sigma-70 factor, ECF subfamily